MWAMPLSGLSCGGAKLAPPGTLHNAASLAQRKGAGIRLQSHISQLTHNTPISTK